MNNRKTHGPEFLKMYMQKKDIVNVLNNADIADRAIVIGELERRMISGLTTSMLKASKIRPHKSNSDPSHKSSSSTKQKGRLSRSADGFFAAKQRVEERGSIANRVATLKSEIENFDSPAVINDIHKYLSRKGLTSELQGNYSPMIR